MHQVSGECVENVTRAAATKRTLDNITGVIIGFENFNQSIDSQVNVQVGKLLNGDLNLNDVDQDPSQLI